ncbi:alkyl/aryl-sulfatase [Candidatus Viadribacter manganicus]|uniref:Linear primary-alkylsulfatase n=1 Tax=Candidatus Viadribacter manganicus TaxID=1759059 RepID=A0A1B1AKR6_9PROT|nr:alkyl sulfatase dimerization domain-containing protein [Candidatus Viadribacter manganicus]ANP47154.1 alkyl sulfatase [Candidatus Viadribacter manganicus]
MRSIWAAVIFAFALTGAASAQVSEATRAANAAFAQTLPWADREDEDFANRGFVVANDAQQIRTADGNVAWDFSVYNFLHGDAPDSVNPSLWRHAQLLARAGLFRVTDRVYQIRGFDVSNMTIVIGDTGLIIIDPLSSSETAAAGLALARRTIGDRPVRAVIYTHSHLDHFGGVRGVVPAGEEAGVEIIAPDGFMEHAVTENVIAGNAMSRRAQYQFGAGLVPGPEGQMTSGIGIAVSAGTFTLIPPTRTITHTGETLTIDGVRIEFQLTPDTEAPAEMNFFFPDLGVLCIAENATASMHNILTPRGALVRDAKAWADYLTEALRLYGDRTQIMVNSHAWPRFGGDRVRDFIASHRDAYKYLHDQTVRLMNAGYTDREIAEQVRLPEALSARWFNHGYYGTMMHNSRAVYQRYMGWYDANPANLNPLPPAEEGERFVRAMGGPDRVLAEGQRAFDEGDYRWAARVLNHLVFAAPDNTAARQLLARTHRQMAYQAESAIWRNMYLVAARELEQGPPTRSQPTQSADLVAATPTSYILDLLAVRLNPERLGARRYAFNLVFPERNERFAVTIANGVLVHERDQTVAAAPTITSPRAVFLQAMATQGMARAVLSGQIRIQGNRRSLEGLGEVFDNPEPNFPIVTP